MNDKQQRDAIQPWKEEMQQEETTRQQPNPFEEAAQKDGSGRSPEEEAEAEQQYKEALTERD